MNFWVKLENQKLLKTASKNNGHTMGAIINALIEQKLADPIKVLEDQRRDHAIMISELTEKIAVLKGVKKESPPAI